MRRVTTWIAKRTPQTRRGFTIVEILIAVLIIGILSAILIPVYINRTEEARITACKDELQHLADSQERAAIQLGYYLRLYALDDLPGKGDGIGLGPGDVKDAFTDEYIDTTSFNNFYLKPKEMFIQTKTAEMLLPAQADTVYQTLAANDGLKWTGPYYNIQKDETVTTHVNSSNVPTHLLDTPNDPWGNDYILILRYRDAAGDLQCGMMVEPDGEVQNAIPGQPVADFTLFDRPAIVSLGPDGVPGDGGKTTNRLGEGDDLYRMFGY